MAEKYDIEQTLQILTGDSEFLKVLHSVIFSNETQLYLISELLVNNSTTIANSTVVSMVGIHFLETDIAAILGVCTTELLTATLYSYKYAAVKRFFIRNYKNFLPEYDYVQVSTQEKTKLFVEAFMREFDRFSLIIDNIYNTVDIDKVPVAYLQYLGQLIGYEKEDFLLVSNITFRELLKNIIEVYKIKGTNYSLELFYNFLGFDITIQEFWFDKRYGDPNIGINPYTASVDKNSYLFYLTPIKPTETIPDGVSLESNNKLPVETQVKNSMSLEMFDLYIGWYSVGDSRGFSYKQLIGDTTGFTGDTYTYFKTNAIQYSLKSLNTGQEAELTADEITVIDLYAQFLTPIFIKRKIVLSAAPYLETGSATYLKIKEEDRLDPVYRGYKINSHTWEFKVKSIETNVGDTNNPRSRLTIYDTDKILINNIKYWDIIELTGDTKGDTVAGLYKVWGDTKGDSYPGDTFGRSYYWQLGYTYLELNSILIGTNRGDSGAYVKTGGRESMFQIHEGDYPKRYYWDDPAFGDSVLINYFNEDARIRHFGDSITRGGNYISGYHTDTRNAVYNPSLPTSAYSAIKNANLTWNDEQIKTQINSIIRLGDSVGGLYNYVAYSPYRVRSRDFMFPVDTERKITPGDTRSRAGDSWRRYNQHRPSGLTTGDSVWVLHGGFMNPTLLEEESGSETGPITLGMSKSMEYEAYDRLYEPQYIEKTRRDYYIVRYDKVNKFNYDTIILGKRGSFAAKLTDKGGDSTFKTLFNVGSSYITGDTIYGGGDSATITSITKLTDERFKIYWLDVQGTGSKGEIYVNDKGDTWSQVLNKLTSDDYITVYGTGGLADDAAYRVVSSTKLSGDTTRIYFGDSFRGSDIRNTGYIYINNAGKIRGYIRDSGSSRGAIKIYDRPARFRNLKAGDTVIIKCRGDTNSGTYKLYSDAAFARYSGDSAITTLTFTTLLNGQDGDSITNPKGGMVEVFSKYWTMNEYTYRQHDYIELIKMYPK